MRVMVAGINIRHIACSAARAGHEVFAADCFCDLDLEGCTRDAVCLPRREARDCISDCIERFHPDAIVFGPGFEEVRAGGAPVMSNLPEKASLVADKLWLAGWLERQGFPFIRTKSAPEGLGYPFLVKPRKGAGGVGCRIVERAEDLQWAPDLIAQDYVQGIPASVSVIGTGHESRAVAVNEQLVGERWAGAGGFRYVGNITPLQSSRGASIDRALADMAERIVSGLGLIGSNGVDFLLTPDGPVVVEVNARFQGSLDAVEKTTGINIFQAHLDAFCGRLPERTCPQRTAGRAIIYADRDLRIKEDLRILGSWARDVPRPGSSIARSDPILSILASGQSRDSVLSQLKERAAALLWRVGVK